MSYFAKSLSEAPLLLPLSTDRLADVLAAADLSLGRSDDSESLGAYWNEHLVEFVCFGDHSEVLQVYAHWGRPVGPEAWDALLASVNARNAKYSWPKLYVDRDSDGKPFVIAEHVVDYEFGVTDQQIMMHVRCAIDSALKAFRQLDEQFPEAVAAWRAEHPNWGE